MSAAGCTASAIPAVLPSTRQVTYAGRMEPNPDDTALMLRYQQGDVQAFELLYQRHNDPLFRYLFRMSLQRQVAEDLFQEVWSKIIASRDRYRPTAKFTTFLYRVAHNSFIDFTRRNKKYGGQLPFDAELAADHADLPDTLAEKSLLRERLLLALTELPIEQRDAFLLHEEAGLNLDAIAHATGVSRETAKSRVRYANNKLKAALLDPALPARDAT